MLAYVKSDKNKSKRPPKNEWNFEVEKDESWAWEELIKLHFCVNGSILRRTMDKYRCIQFLKLFVIFYWLVFGLFLIQFWLILLILLGHFYKYFGSMFHRILGLFRPAFVHFWNIFHQSWSIFDIFTQFLIHFGSIFSQFGSIYE